MLKESASRPIGMTWSIRNFRFAIALTVGSAFMERLDLSPGRHPVRERDREISTQQRLRQRDA
jgi:hypothetical protein